MSTFFKKLLSVLCCALLLAQFLPGTLWAEEGTSEGEQILERLEEELEEEPVEETEEEGEEEETTPSPEPVEEEEEEIEETPAPEEETPEPPTEAPSDPTEEPSEPTEEPSDPTEEPSEPEETPEGGEEEEAAGIDYALPVAENLAFVEGWVILLETADLSEEIDDEDPMGTITGADGILYAFGRDAAGEEGDSVSAALNASGELLEGFVDAGQVRPLSPEEVEAYLLQAEQEEEKILRGEDAAYPLLPVDYTAFAPEPTKKPPDPENGDLQAKATEIKCTTLAQFASAHPYSNSMDTTWVATFANATSITVTFDNLTEVESGYDYIYVGRSADAMQAYTGTSLRGQSVTVSGNTLRIRLKTDSTTVKYGFAVTNIVANGISLPRPAAFYPVVDNSLNAILNWSAVSGANSYQVYRAELGSAAYTLLGTTSKLTYTDTSAKASATKLFTYKVVPRFTFDTIIASTGAESALVHCRFATNNIKIASLTANSTNKITIKWNAQPGATGYQIYRSTSAGEIIPRAAVGAVASYTDTVTTGTAYYYRVCPIFTESGGAQAYGRVSDAVKGERGIAKPGKPTTQAIKDKQIKVSWAKVPNATSYTVYRSTKAASGYKKMGTTTARTFTDKKAKSGTCYYYKITATGVVLGAKETSAQSAYAAGLTTGKPTLKVRQLNAEEIKISWTKAKGASGYRIMRKAPGETEYKQIKKVSSSKRNYTEKIPQGKKYRYMVIPIKKVGSTTFAGSKSATKAIQLKLKTTYRALLIGEANYYYQNNLPACKYDVNGMQELLSGFNGTKYTTINKKTDVTASSIVMNIRSTFKNATSRDVSLFYFSGHGLTGSPSSGAILAVDNYYISPSYLRSLLDEIPGKKIVIIAACGSGAMISDRSAKSESFDTAAFAEAFTNAFENDGASDKTFYIQDDDEGEYATKIGELANSDYFVLTAAKIGQLSWCYPRYDIFTRAITTGMGYDYYTKARTGSPADANGDGSYSMKEIYNYVAPIVAGVPGASSNIRAYPSRSSNKVLFKR